MQTFSPETYPELLTQKHAHLKTLLDEFSPPDIEVFASNTEHFRLRAEFRIWHTDERCFYAMFNPGDKHTPIEITHFPIGAKKINELMPKLLATINQTPELKHKLFQVDFLTTLSEDALISLLYHKPLDESWECAAQKLQNQLGVPIIGRARKQKRVLERDYVNESFSLNNKSLSYQQIENSFTQPNGLMNIKMLEWAQQQCEQSQGDLLELYCGNGNFSIALAPYFRKVLATEISKTSVKSAFENIKTNEVENLKIARISSEEFMQALKGEREFRRLKEQDIQITDYEFSTVLVDPPRAGLDDKTLDCIKEFERIVYISCNPNTLAQNLKTLSKTHRITKAALFDQFPYTEHIETGLLLEKIKGCSG